MATINLFDLVDVSNPTNTKHFVCDHLHWLHIFRTNELFTNDCTSQRGTQSLYFRSTYFIHLQPRKCMGRNITLKTTRRIGHSIYPYDINTGAMARLKLAHMAIKLALTCSSFEYCPIVSFGTTRERGHT